LKVFDQGIITLWSEFHQDYSDISRQSALHRRLQQVYPEEDNANSVIQIGYDSSGEVYWYPRDTYHAKPFRVRPNFFFAAVLSFDRIASEGSKSARVYLRDRLDGSEYEVMARDAEPIISTMVGGHCMGIWTFAKRSGYISLKLHEHLEV
jgi:hypothetical protein